MSQNIDGESLQGMSGRGTSRKDLQLPLATVLKPHPRDGGGYLSTNEPCYMPLALRQPTRAVVARSSGPAMTAIFKLCRLTLSSTVFSVELSGSMQYFIYVAIGH